MVHWFCALVLVFYTIDQSFCINCYSCSSRINESCSRPYSNKIPVKQCGSVELNNTKAYAEQLSSRYAALFTVDIESKTQQPPLNCLKQVVKMTTGEIVIRGCQLAPSANLDICKKIKKEEVQGQHTVHCSLCSTDNCNSAYDITSTSFTPLFTLIIFLLCYSI